MKILFFILIICLTSIGVRSNNSDTTIIRLNESTAIEYFSDDIMILSYQDINEVKSRSFGYDMCFQKGKLDSIIYHQDTIKIRILYRRTLDNKWEMRFGKSENYIYPADYNRLSTYSHCGIEGQNYYQFTMQYDVNAEAIKSLEQRVSSAGGKQVGIILTFKNGRTRFMNIMSSIDRASPTIYFNRRGKIKKMYVLDFIDQNTGLSMYTRLKYSKGKMK